MPHPALTAAVGLASGVLSGAFGIGGGLVTTPAIKLLLGYPALIAVGTPLPVIIPTALTGALAYRRSGLTDLRAAGIMGASGAGFAVLGAWSTRYAGGGVVMLATALLIGWAALDMLGRSRTAGAAEVGSSGTEPIGPTEPVPPAPWARLALLGAATGLYSGFLGLGGGFVIVPVLTRWLGWPIKRAIGTSLATVALLAVPGSIAHHLLGNIDWLLALLLAAGAVPGALLGARLTAAASERHVAAAFGILLAVTAIALAWGEIAALMP